MRISNCGLKQGRLCARPNCNSQSAIRTALTLVELLVVIVILTTLVGGVIPVLSPNNDVRKIQAASRGLQGYITVTQTKAAQTGRPHGIAFRESSAGSGVALEVFGLEVPPAFSGFSTESRCVLSQVVSGTLATQPLYYNVRTALFDAFPEYFREPIYRLQFVLTPPSPAASNTTPVEDPLPPRMFRIGDQIHVGGNIFLIVDTANNTANLTNYDGGSLSVANYRTSFLGSANTPQTAVECVWVNDGGQVPPITDLDYSQSPPVPKLPYRYARYKIYRQPMPSTDEPYQLPAGIVIDMQASVAEGSETTAIAYPRFPTRGSLFTDRRTAPDPPGPLPDVVSIMFSPTGAVERLLLNESELRTPRVALLIGRIENGGLDPLTINQLSNSNDAPWFPQGSEKIEDVQERINWLNLDSRLVSIVPSSGRVVVSEPAFVDPGHADFTSLENGEAAEAQIEAAHGLAHEMNSAL